ncbi:hypothetical protein GCM10011365_14000 [Marinicella pacifica]|uniref:Repeat protein (TIGR01451 family) n=1 Tax=Marinicella pacifica TaxID=1171543 RepID=A0A917CPB3_9GAMM|nr:IPTL-CTERM sorting domain-containing protein [Marinicella pacifica]GGF93933.1 hypothetical protein GCM10011365_14000 [Marinicella pacifica]
MTKKLLTLVFLCACFAVNAAPGLDGDVTLTTNTTVNEYARVTSIVNAGTIVVTVDDINNLDDSQGIYTNTDLSPGDRIMLYQAQGASYASAGNNTNTYGDFNLNSAGRYEIHEVLSVTGNDIVVAEQGNLCLADQLIYSYSTSHTQVIRVPQFNNLIVNNGVTVSAAPWNGTIGGVLAVDVAGTLTVNGFMDVSGQGFRGGVIDNDSSPASESRPLYYYSSPNDGAEKGESILGFQTEYDNYGGRYGRGAPANGGGGGNGHNAGGGGGANGGNTTWNGQGNPDLSGTNWNQAWDIDGTLTSATTSSGGGRGGYTYGRANLDALTVPPGDPSWNGNNRQELGGLGGRPVPFDDTGRLFFGGGGGAGDGNNNQAGGGGAGGGLIYIIANSIDGSGQILANGADGEDTQGGSNNDAPGGGGGGGTVVISAASFSGPGIFADGGVGGDQLTIGNESEGPGGGGGGGVIAYSGGLTTTSAAGGGNGSSASDSVTEFTPNGATMGGSGLPAESTTAVADLPICTAGADVQVVKNLTSTGPYIAGSTVTYSITVTNNGLNTANNIQVTDTPTNLNINTVSSANCSAFPCTIPFLVNGASEVINVTATIIATGAFDNSTTVTANEPDPDPSNNTDNTGNGGSAGASADVAVTKTLDTAGPYSNGQNIQYTLVVSNNGPDSATNVQVTDTPTNLTINTVSSTNCSAFPCTIPSLANGGSETITVTATINSTGAFDNATAVTADETDPNTGNNNDNTGNGGTAGASADVAVTKTLDTAGPYSNGQSIQYTLVVSNNGPDTATNVQVTDTPTNLTINTVSSINCSAFPCTIPSLANGGSETITVTATINSAGAFDNSTTVNANEPDPDPSNNTDNTGNGGTAGASADVAVTKTLDTAGPYSNGQSIQYTLVVSNNGPDTATNVQVTDTPTNLTINMVTSTNCSAFPCTIPSLANGGSETITVTATINSAGAFDNATNVSADETDPDPSNNDDNTGNGGTAGVSADMAIVKTLLTSGPFSPGQSIQYSLVVSNNGPDTANNVVVTDTPTNLSITSVSSVNCSALPCTIPSMVNGGSETITVTTTINGPGNFDNAAAVTADETDPVTTNNQDNTGNGGSVTAPAQPVPSLSQWAMLILVSLMALLGIRRRLD